MSSNNNAVAGPPKPPRSEAIVRRVDWPVACSLLLGVLFLERLSFSFIKAGLAPHLHDSLGMDRDVAETCVQLVVQVTFFAPIVGAMLADAKYGKYGALRSLFPVYFLGQVLLSCSPVLPAPGFIHPYFDFFALFLLSYGCGCCRAVLAAYGADQLWPLNGPQLGLFFALFYAQEHLASVFCSLLLPFLKTAVPLLPLPKPSLGVLLLATTLLCFAMAQLLGLNRFFRQNMPQGQQSVFSRARHTIGHAIHNKWRHPVVAAKRQQSKPEAQPTKKDLLDHFLDDHNCARDKECDFGRRQMCGQAKFLAELKAALRTGMMLAPLPLFWALHSQLIATSAVQAQNVDLTLPFLGPVLSADQLNLLPSLLFLLLLPLFVMLFNSPGLARLCSLNTYLRRMSAGILLAAMACSLAASVQMLLDMSASPPVQPPPDSALFKVFNIFPADCSVSMSRVADPKGAEFFQVSAGDGGSRPLPLLPSEAAAGFSDFQFRFNGSACAGHRKSRVRIWIQRGKLNVAVVGPQGIGWAAVEVRRGAASQLLGVLVLLPCNSLDSPLPRECANSSGDPLAFSLMPFASGISLCSSATQQQSTDANNSSIAASDNSNNSISSSLMVAAPPESNCPLSWAADEAVASQLFVFPPRGDNLGMARSSLYKPKAVQLGSYKLSLIPTIGEVDSSSSSSPNDSSAASQSADSAAVAATAAADSDQTSNSSGGGLKQEIRIADAGGVSLVVLSLDGSPLAGQNDSSSARPTPTITILALAGHASLNIIWLLPQNLLLAASEVLLCVSGLEFCYSQAPNAVRATMIGCWYLTIYVGMSLTPLLSKFQPFSNPSYSLLLASSSLFTVGIVFASLAHFFFKYRDNFTGAFANGGDSTHAPQSGLAEKLEGTLRASMARLPTKKVIRL